MNKIIGALMAVAVLGIVAAPSAAAAPADTATNADPAVESSDAVESSIVWYCYIAEAHAQVSTPVAEVSADVCI